MANKIKFGLRNVYYAVERDCDLRQPGGVPRCGFAEH